MGDDDAGDAQAGDGGVDRTLAGDIEMAGGFVQQQDARPPIQCVLLARALYRRPRCGLLDDFLENAIDTRANQAAGGLGVTDSGTRHLPRSGGASIV